MFAPVFALLAISAIVAMAGPVLAGPPTLKGAAQTAVDATPMAGALAGKNLIVITLDTTRADHVSCYGNPKAEGLTPNMDRLAAEGTLFLNAYSQTNVTNPSHTAIFTGLYAIDSKIMNNQTTLPTHNPGVDTLPAAFQRAHYRSVGFPATPHVSDTTLRLPGFDERNDLVGSPIADEMVDKALAWIDTPSDKPFFMWLHLFDPHMKYDPPEAYATRFYRGDPKAGDDPPFRDDPLFMRSPDIVKEQFGDVRDRSFPAAMYNGEISFTDAQIGRLVDGLKKRGMYDTTGIVVIADHGESLGEHDIFFDHFGLYEPSLRIPLIVRLPGFPSGVRVADTVTQIDLVPTIGHVYGVAVHQPDALEMHGLNVTNTLLGRPDPAVTGRVAFVHEDAHNRQVLARRGPWKLIWQIRPPKYPDDPVMLFNLEDDPDETHNLADGRPEVVARMKPMIQRWIDQGKWELKNAAPKPERLSPAERARLEAERNRLKGLGYIDEDEGDDDHPAPTRVEAPGKDPASRLSMGEFGDAVRSSAVGLTTDQRREIAAVFARARDALKKRPEGATPEALRERARGVRQKVRDDVRALLTATQRTALDEAVRKAVAKKDAKDDGK